MKLRNFFEFLGFRGKPRHYGYTLHDFTLQDGNIVRYAGWNHPREEPKQINDRLIDGYRQYIRPGDFCIDIGAHTGDTTIPMALAAGTKGCVLALEPNPFVYHVLEKNIRANRDITNIKSIMAAAAPSEGFMTMEYSDSGFCNGGRHEGMTPLQHGHAYKLQVFAVNLEKELRRHFPSELPNLRFIKVDAEGYDLRILKSLEPVIRDFRPLIRTEVFKASSGDYRQELFSWLGSLDYQICEFSGDSLTHGATINHHGQLSLAHADILAFPSASGFAGC